MDLTAVVIQFAIEPLLLALRQRAIVRPAMHLLLRADCGIVGGKVRALALRELAIVRAGPDAIVLIP